MGLVYALPDQGCPLVLALTGTAGTTFEVLRVRTELERTVGLLTTTVRTFAFVSECFGTVATVTSEDDEDQVEFSRAAEVRRLAP